ncbi:GAF and ANTAR domain-containing protein [Sphaerisporangium dianthi]|uniref:GAF and ANTAR domain-containing protein n=1 Tax=Sphaerisporangium dianthi TaxID=1436120 RepID=A0ABV9CQ86_9ACTN
MNTSQNKLARQTFVELADTLVTDYDVIDFLDFLAHRVVDLLAVTACGVLVADHHGTLNLLAASSEQTRLLELFQLQSAQGPCLDAYRSGAGVHCEDLARTGGEWPLFASAAVSTGYRAVHALPMRLREEVIGAVNLFGTGPGPLDPEDVELGQALADVATIGILHERLVRRGEAVADQLQGALNSRVLIEQAKGALAQQLGISVDQAFTILRAHARRTNSKITEIARAVIGNGLQITVPAPVRTRPGTTG